MAQHDYIIANQSGAAFRSDLNNGLAAIVSQNSGAAQPSTTYAYQWWADTTTGLLKLRNAANNAWITIGTLADANLGLLSLAGGTLTGALLADDSGTAALPAIAFDGDTNTGIFRAGADQLGIATNGVERVEFGTTEVVFNDGGADVDFRVEGDTNANLFKIDAGLDQVQVANLNGGPLAGFRNRIINGNFAVLQRGNPFTTAGYGVDRWITTWAGGGSIQFGSTTNSPAPGFQESGFINYVSGTITDAIFTQRIESANCKDLASGGQITISFWAFTNKTGGWTPSYDLKFPTAADNYTTTTAIVNGVALSAIAANTWTKLTVTVTLSGTPSNGLELTIHTGAMASGENRLITGVQLEPGAVATPFEQRPIGTELALCQRYFETGHTKIFVGSNSTNILAIAQTYAVPKRATAPTLAYSAPPAGTFNAPTALEWNLASGFSAVKPSGTEIAFAWTSSSEL